MVAHLTKVARLTIYTLSKEKAHFTEKPLSPKKAFDSFWEAADGPYV